MAAQAKRPGKDIVYLDIDDDITTIIDKVERSKEKIVALVLPKRFSVLQSIVNMRLLKRSAEAAAKSVVLVTSEPPLLPLAGAAEIPVAKNLQSKPEIPPSPIEIPQPKPKIIDDPDAVIDAESAKLDYHRSIGELAAADTLEEPETIPLEDTDEEFEAEEKTAQKTPKDKKFKIPNFERFRVLLVLGVFALISLVVFLFLAITVWPKATIILKTEATPISADFVLTASDKVTKLSLTEGVIPAILKKSDLKSTQQVRATGEQNNGKKAAGSVNMEVEDCAPFGAAPKDVPAGSGISSGGLFYITQENAHFLGPSISSPTCVKYTASAIDIIAQAGGSKYNISNATFSVTGRSDVNASGSTSGGTDDIQTVLSQADVDGAVNKISEEDKKKFIDNFKKELNDADFYVIDGTLSAGAPDVKATPPIGQTATDAEVVITINYSVLVVPKGELRNAIVSELSKNIDKSKQKIGSKDVLEDITVGVQSQKSPTEATLNISANTTSVSIIDEAALKKQIGGLKSGEIQSLLGELPGVKEVQVKMSPFWVSKAPKKAGKITIVVEQIKTKEANGAG